MSARIRTREEWRAREPIPVRTQPHTEKRKLSLRKWLDSVRAVK